MASVVDYNIRAISCLITPKNIDNNNLSVNIAKLLLNPNTSIKRKFNKYLALMHQTVAVPPPLSNHRNLDHF